MGFYEEMQQTAADVLRDFNQSTITLVTITPGNGSAGDPGPSTETATVLDGATARGASFRYVQRGLAASGDMQVTMHARGVKPTQRDFMEINGTRYKIVEVIEQPPAPVPSVYVAILRR